MKIQETNELSKPTGSVSDAARGAVEVCNKTGVNRVIPAIHHGCLRFLLSEGPENVGGIVFRDDTYNYDALKKLADEVNEILTRNNGLEIYSK